MLFQLFLFFFKRKTAYDMRISDWSSDVCSSDLSMRKTIARRLTESKQTVPHIYLTMDVQLDKLLKLRSELNAGLTGRGVKLSVNDLLIKALAVSLMQVPECNEIGRAHV